jgi:putative nucleotidyltransferase with HDIG domain
MVARAEVAREIDKLSELPILPQVLITLNKVAEDDNASAEDLGKIILKDQGLTMQLLKLVNSAYYRQQKRERVTTVSKAVIILGFNGVRRLALGMSVFSMLKDANRLSGLSELWSHALTVAITARQLAARTGYLPAEEAFVAGLTHDIGRVVLARCDPEAWARVIEGAPDSAELRERERVHFGVSHAMAGKKLAHRWSLPAPIEEAIGDHHAYETQALAPGSPLLRMVIGANRFARALMVNPDREGFDGACENLRASFHLTGLQVQELYQGIWREYEELAHAFDIVGAWDPAGGAAAFRPDIDRDEMLNRLQSISAAMVAPGNTPEQVRDLVLDGIMGSVAVERLFLVEPDSTGDSLVCRAWRGRVTPEQVHAFRLPLTPVGGLAARTLLERHPFHVSDPEAPGVRHYLHAGLQAALGPREFATVPLLFQGRAVGLLWYDNPVTGRPLAEPLRNAIATLANTLALVLGGLTPAAPPSEPVHA